MFINNIKEFYMNKNQIQGKAKEVLGEVQQKVGKVLGNTNQLIKGHAKEVEGKVQKNVGNLQESVKDKLQNEKTKL